MTDQQLLIQLGGKIRSIRQAKKIKQCELAGLCDFEKASLSRIESGITNPTMLTLKKISDALNIDISMLFKEPDTTISHVLLETRYEVPLNERLGNRV